MLPLWVTEGQGLTGADPGHLLGMVRTYNELVNQLRPGFLKLGVLYWVVLCCGRCPVHCGIFSSTPGPHPSDASSIPIGCEDKKCCQTLPNVPWAAGRGWGGCGELYLRKSLHELL